MQNTSNPEIAEPIPDPESATDTGPDKATEPESQQDAVDSAIAATRADALAIVEMCQLAGHPEQAATFLTQGTPVVQVRRALLTARAESTEISSLIHPDAKPPESRPENNPLMQAVKKLTGKD